MVEVGQMNRLRIVKYVDFGLYLDGGVDGGEILLPLRYVPEGVAVDEVIEVFIYLDSEDRLIATTETPYAMVGECGYLQVSAVTSYGAFLDWGLSKDLLLPFSEQVAPVAVGESHVVCLFIDESSQRITASAKLDEFLHDEDNGVFRVGEEVSLFTAVPTALGYKVVVNGSHWGLLHRHEIVREPKIGDLLTGYIKHIRDDGRLDTALYQRPSAKSDEVADAIMAALVDAGGYLAVTDSSSPQEIRSRFGVSKRLYKRALGTLYRKHLITIEEAGVRAKAGRSS
ncbi:MAG: S1-like domain-containing RNA-binding protein [Mariprofundales bacterium]|nr:S1-like domain-containing RNA-binding protein [Mariprofundales bacterium]